jgi:hypothetical protein
VTHSALIHRQLANAKKLEARMPGVKVMPTAAKMHRKVYKRAFLGNELLQKGDAPIKGRFSWACITGELDRNKGHWFGLIKTMRDPQMWANKWLSQTLHILNTTAKGGIVAEEGAFTDMTAARKKWGGGLTQGHVDLMQLLRSHTGAFVEGINHKTSGTTVRRWQKSTPGDETTDGPMRG